MEVEVIKEIIQAFKDAELTSLSLKCEDFKLELGKEVKLTSMSVPMESTRDYVSFDQDTSLGIPVKLNEEKITTNEVAASHQKVIKSPIVGTFYAASSPTSKPFVEVGSYVKKGEVVCMVEAMKLMNEIEAEEDGQIVEILVTNEEMVEYGQPLFVMK